MLLSKNRLDICIKKENSTVGVFFRNRLRETKRQSSNLKEEHYFISDPFTDKDLDKIKSGEPVGFNQFSARVTPARLASLTVSAFVLQ